MILTVRTDQSILQTTNETLPCRCSCHCRQLEDDGRLSVAELRGWSAAHAGHRCGHGRRCVCPQHPCYLPCCVYSIARLSCCQAKTIKGRSEQKAEYFIYEQKSESDIKTWKLSAKNEKLADVSYCTQQFRLCWNLQDVERPAYTQIYTAVDHINGNSRVHIDYTIS